MYARFGRISEHRKAGENGGEVYCIYIIGQCLCKYTYIIGVLHRLESEKPASANGQSWGKTLHRSMVPNGSRQRWCHVVVGGKLIMGTGGWFMSKESPSV